MRLLIVVLLLAGCAPLNEALTVKSGADSTGRRSMMPRDRPNGWDGRVYRVSVDSTTGIVCYRDGNGFGCAYSPLIGQR